jgi:hypothetical protein
MTTPVRTWRWTGRVQLPPKPLHLLDSAERVAFLEDVARELSKAHLDLSQVKIQYMWAYGQAYKMSHSQHISGRIQEAEIAAAGIKEDELTLLGQIDSLTVMRDYLVGLDYLVHV